VQIGAFAVNRRRAGGGAALTAPVLSNLDVYGKLDITLPADCFEGYTLHMVWEDATPSVVQHLYKMITPAEIAGLPVNWYSNATPPPRDYTTHAIAGKAPGVGVRSVHCYIERDDGSVSPNSNTLTATLVAVPDNLPNLQAFIDPYDITQLFQDANGTVPVTSIGDPVVLIKDKSPLGTDLVVVAGTATHTALGVSCSSDIRFESARLNVGCATVIWGARIDSSNGPWVGFIGQKAGVGGGSVGYAYIREGGNNNFFSRDSDAGSLANNTHFWRNKTNQDKNFTPNTHEVYSCDGTGRSGAITFGNTPLCLGAVPATGSGSAQIIFDGLILIGSTDAQIASASDRHIGEDFINAQSGAY
jgi:hypothetical protein